MAHTLYEDRDLNSGQELFDGIDAIKVDPEMVQLATQLVQRQAGKYDASDLEDRYETRLRALIEAKLKGEGIDAAEEPQIVNSNVVDLMAALKKSLGHGWRKSLKRHPERSAKRQRRRQQLIQFRREAERRAPLPAFRFWRGVGGRFLPSPLSFSSNSNPRDAWGFFLCEVMSDGHDFPASSAVPLVSTILARLTVHKKPPRRTEVAKLVRCGEGWGLD